jgi:hypothetical protein
MHPTPAKRPSTKELLSHALLQSKLERALAQERKMSAALSKELVQHKHAAHKRVAMIKGITDAGLHRSLTM